MRHVNWPSLTHATREKPLPTGVSVGTENMGGQQGLRVPEIATAWLCILAPTLELCGGAETKDLISPTPSISRGQARSHCHLRPLQIEAYPEVAPTS